MTNAQIREALRSIIVETEKLCDLAQRSGAGFLVFHLETVLKEARAELAFVGTPAGEKAHAARPSA